ncbi:MAG: VOC family protein [Alphaproteobacteria bacterium]|nr:MAG: VOC family protein [Alphaproteobacteria bacterium]
MDQRISALTLGVDDLTRATRFYTEGLGWQQNGGEEGVIAFFQLNGFVLGLYDAQMLADEASGGARGSGFGGIALAHNVTSKEAVDALLAQAVAAGGSLIKPAEDVFWGGYSGYFADPDGHRWEVAYNPYWPITEDGRTLLSDD